MRCSPRRLPPSALAFRAPTQGLRVPWRPTWSNVRWSQMQSGSAGLTSAGAAIGSTASEIRRAPCPYSRRPISASLTNSSPKWGEHDEVGSCHGAAEVHIQPKQGSSLRDSGPSPRSLPQWPVLRDTLNIRELLYGDFAFERGDVLPDGETARFEIAPQARSGLRAVLGRVGDEDLGRRSHGHRQCLNICAQPRLAGQIRSANDASLVREERLEIGLSRSCSATWWGRARSLHALIPKSRAASSPGSTAAAPTSEILGRHGRPIPGRRGACVFRYPTAHENDAERAILAGLAILKAVGGVRTAADKAG